MTLPVTPVNLSTPPGNLDPVTRNYLMLLVKQVTGALLSRAPREQPQPSVLLASPDGSVYTVTVTNAGVLTTTLVKSP
jgi:predicted component of type VI protein secretion system